ncbi:hypothetical protein EK21DRAFT_10197, partial [Setomelanomma holmii]
APTEEVAHDDLCPICQLLLFTPVRTQCNHLLCASCMAQWADVSSTNRIEHTSLDVNLTNFDPNYDPMYDLEAGCPMCRTHTTASADNVLAKKLEKKYPTTYAVCREKDRKGNRARDSPPEGVMILIGNKHRLVRGAEDDNQHDWTFFVRISRPELVQEVRVKLHPTLHPPRLVLRDPPYEVRQLGWGWFTIEAEIVLKEPYSWTIDNSGTRQPGLELSWLLDFEGRGRQGRVRAKVKKSEGDALEADRATRHSPVRWPHMDDEDDEEDDED